MCYLKKNFPENYNFQSTSLRAFIVKAFIEFKKQTQKIFIILTVLGKLLYSYVVSQYKNTFNLASLPQGLPSAFRKKPSGPLDCFIVRSQGIALCGI